MTDIEYIGDIHREELDEAHYLTSLLRAAQERDLLTAGEFSRISEGVNGEIARVIVRSSHGTSSSIRSEVAATIAESTVYTISMALKKEPAPSLALKRLKSDDMLNIFLDGYDAIKSKLTYIRGLADRLQSTLLPVDNAAYKGFIGGIYGFLRKYDPDYTAHLYHISADYPVAVDISSYAGVEFIAKYLEAMYYENTLLTKTGARNVTSLLKEARPASDGLYNIFSLVYRLSLLRLACDMPLYGAPLSSGDKEDLEKLLCANPGKLDCARGQLYDIIKIKEGGAKNYADFVYENNIRSSLERYGARAFISAAFG